MNGISAEGISAYFTALLIIALCGVILFRVFSAPFKLIFALLLNSVLGGLALFFASFILSLFEITLGVNVFSAVVVGILGIPGLVLVIVLNFLL